MQMYFSIRVSFHQNWQNGNNLVLYLFTGPFRYFDDVIDTFNTSLHPVLRCLPGRECNKILDFELSAMCENDQCLIGELL